MKHLYVFKDRVSGNCSGIFEASGDQEAIRGFYVACAQSGTPRPVIDDTEVVFVGSFDEGSCLILTNAAQIPRIVLRGSELDPDLLGKYVSYLTSGKDDADEES